MTKGQDFTNMKFGKLFVIKKSEQRNEHNHILWECICECGNTKLMTSSALNRAVPSTSCGCGTKAADLTDKIFGRLVVLNRVENNRFGSARWLCRCSCGKEKVIAASHLLNGTTNSCGCLQSDLSSARKLTHGMSRERIYDVHWQMIDRCENPENSSYENYGGRGIKVDPIWRGLESFLSNMPEGYTDNMTIERIDTNKDYSPDNCCWVLKEDQSRNRTKYKTNKSGVPGVYYDKRSQSWVATWCVDGVAKSKRYAVRKYGDEVAFEMATKTRAEMIQELKDSGINYSEYHGCDKVFR